MTSRRARGCRRIPALPIDPMNKAFTRETDDAPDDDEGDGPGLPPLPAGTRHYITPQGYRRLREELMTLLDVERPKVVEIVAWAASNGDRSENGDYLLAQILYRVAFLAIEVPFFLGFGWLVFRVPVRGSFGVLALVVLVGALAFLDEGLVHGAQRTVSKRSSAAP